MDIEFGPPDRHGDLPGSALQQCVTYATVMAAFGCVPVMADIHERGVHLGRARIHLRRFGPVRVAWLPRGPVWTDAATLPTQRAALRLLRRSAPWRALWVMGADAVASAPGLRVSKGCQMAELDLTPCAADSRAAQHGKWRNRLKRAESAGLSVTARHLRLPQDAALLGLETAQRRVRGYAALPPSFTEKWCDLAPNDTLLLTAEENGTPLGFVLMLLHAPVATYHIGWSGPRGRALNVHNLLLWQASQNLAARGYARLDLGLTDPARMPGLTRFKMGTGALPRALGPTILCL